MQYVENFLFIFILIHSKGSNWMYFSNWSQLVIATLFSINLVYYEKIYIYLVFSSTSFSYNTLSINSIASSGVFLGNCM